MECKTTRNSRVFRAKHTMEERVAVRHGNSIRAERMGLETISVCYAQTLERRIIEYHNALIILDSLVIASIIFYV
jgi:hypothetical protein